MNIKKLVAFLLLTGIAASLSAQNMNRYIIVKLSSKGKTVSLCCDASAVNPAKIVSGTNSKIVKTASYVNFNAYSDTLYVFGNVTIFNCSKNSCIEAIDLSHNMQLKELYCSETKVRKVLAGTDNTALKVLDCSKTPVNEDYLDTRAMLGLESLFLDSALSMNFPYLNRNTKLKILSCSYTRWKYLDLSNLTSLEKLDCSNNKDLQSLDVSKNTALKELNCSGTYIKSLDLSKNTKLTSLDCSYNENLYSVDVSKNSELTKLVCCYCKISGLSVGNNEKLTYLNCEGNNISKLGLLYNTKLEHLNCSYNQISGLLVPNSPELKSLRCNNNIFCSDYRYIDLLMCLLPERKSNEEAIFCPVYSSKSTADLNEFNKCNSNNAKAKNWDVRYYSGGKIPSTDGKYDCNGGSFPNSVREAAVESAMRVWPNPARTHLHITGAAGELRVHDITGRVVYRAEAGSDEIVVNIADWAKGMYFVRSGRQILKFVKE